MGRSLTPADLREARKRLGLTQHGLAEALQMGPNGADRVREWEQGKREITGPASVAIRLLLKDQR
jgi:DNA-binding transcriptional regulator YiaG